MNESRQETSNKRILVAFDASTQNRLTLETALQLATKLEAELIGLFIEDINLFQLTGLPCAIEIRFPYGMEEQPDASRIERELKIRAQQTQEMLAALAERAQVRWSFQVVRGNLTTELLTAAAGADWLLLGSSGFARHKVTIRKLLEQEKHNVQLIT